MNSRDRLLYGTAISGHGRGGWHHPLPGTAPDGLNIHGCSLAGTALEPGQRGVVLGPPVIDHGNGRFSTTPFDRASILAAMLFWDVIEYPSNRAIEIGIGEVNDLVAMGAVQRSEVSLSGRIDVAKTLTAAGNAVIRELSGRDPGRWSVWRQPGTVELGEQITKTDAASVQLTQAILLPPIDAPFQDVLEFRERRQHELRRLRDKLDSLGEMVATAADSERAFARAHDEVVAGLEAARRVTQERWALSRLVDLDLSFDLSSAMLAAMSASAASSMGAHPLVAAAAGGISFAVKPRRRPGLGPTSNPFDVICTLERELPTRS
jgi:hypothetical protein